MVDLCCRSHVLLLFSEYPHYDGVCEIRKLRGQPQSLEDLIEGSLKDRHIWRWLLQRSMVRQNFSLEIQIKREAKLSEARISKVIRFL